MALAALTSHSVQRRDTVEISFNEPKKLAVIEDRGRRHMGMGKAFFFRLAIPAAVILVGVLTGNPAFTKDAPERTIVLGGTIGTKGSPEGRWLGLIYTEAFRRLGYDFVYKGYPAKLSSKMSDDGTIDGEIHRVRDYGEAHPTVIRVSEPHFSIRFSAYSKKSDISLESWRSLRETKYRVGYRAGVKKTETTLPLFVDSNRLVSSPNIIQALRKLAKGSIDIYIDTEMPVDTALENNNDLRKLGIRRVGVVESITTHAFLHKKNRYLVPKLAAILRKMRKEGMIERLRLR